MGGQTEPNDSSSEDSCPESTSTENNTNSIPPSLTHDISPSKVVIRDTLYSKIYVNEEVIKYKEHRETVSVKRSILKKVDREIVDHLEIDAAATALIGFAVMIYASARHKLELNLPGARPNCSYRYYWEKFHCDMWADVSTNRKQLESDISELSTSHILRCLKLLKIDSMSWRGWFSSPCIPRLLREVCDNIAYTLSVELKTPITCDPNFECLRPYPDTRLAFDKITAKSLKEFEAYSGAPGCGQKEYPLEWYDLWILIVSSSGDETNSEHFDSIASILSMLSNSLYERI